jgi:hypothetical protein
MMATLKPFAISVAAVLVALLIAKRVPFLKG